LFHPNENMKQPPSDGDRLGADDDLQGRVDASVFESLRVDLEAEYDICGPVRFMYDIALTLEQRGVSSSAIHTERFGSVA
jgi:ferredoxin-NADP reductase